ncbi:inner membrane protein YiaA [Massilia endophytica]|uniref:inner membrane protein YiaA n=1 Tax=Massilia endophytica TaxID=2899220 RepID=UPI001E34C6E2|nr:inner membrane protein YiaA [Massilia endophytica]UGQ46441.1 YiaA/YiaB family protein [Massilia endophytica]
MAATSQHPSSAFAGATWAALLAGTLTYFVGLWNAGMQLNEKGYYFTILMYGLFSAVSLQKSVRDRLEGLTVSSLYFGLCWTSTLLALLLLLVGLWNASITLSEKGFFGMSFALSLFAAVVLQKTVRDSAGAAPAN